MNSTIAQSSVIKKGIKSDVGVSAPLFPNESYVQCWLTSLLCVCGIKVTTISYHHQNTHKS